MIPIERAGEPLKQPYHCYAARGVAGVREGRRRIPVKLERYAIEAMRVVMSSTALS